MIKIHGCRCDVFVRCAVIYVKPFPENRVSGRKDNLVDYAFLLPPLLRGEKRLVKMAQFFSWILLVKKRSPCPVSPAGIHVIHRMVYYEPAFFRLDRRGAPPYVPRLIPVLSLKHYVIAKLREMPFPVFFGQIPEIPEIQQLYIREDAVQERKLAIDLLGEKHRILVP